MKTNKPNQTMREFFSRPDVQMQQEIQKRSHPNSIEHKLATETIKRLAEQIGAWKYFAD